MWPFTSRRRRDDPGPAAPGPPVPAGFAPERIIPGDIAALAKRNVWSGYSGPVDAEPVVAAGIQNLQAELIRLRRLDEQIPTARERFRQSDAEQQRERDRHARTTQDRQLRISSGAGIPATTTDREERVLASGSAAAGYQQEAADAALAAAEERRSRDENALLATGEQLRDLLGAYAAAGIALLTAYVAALNQGLSDEGKPTLPVLDAQEWTARLVEGALDELRTT